MILKIIYNEFLRARIFIYNLRKKISRYILKIKILQFVSSKEGTKFKLEGNFISRFGLSIFPYPFQLDYNVNNVNIHFDKEFPYFIYKGKIVFLPKSWSLDKLKSYANSVLLEQDFRSPHCYQTSLFELDQNDVLLDIGCGEANFSLENIQIVKKVFLFESNQLWIPTLEKTFYNWKEKVVYSNLRMGFDSIDFSFVKEWEFQNIVLKIDVDGGEREVLRFLDPLLVNFKSIKVAICTYHQNRDASDFEYWFKSRGFNTQFGEGFMVFYYDKEIEKPYFRPGVLFAYRQ